MAEGDGALYDSFKTNVLNGSFDLTNDTIRVILVTGHTPDYQNHASYAQVSADETSGTGYTAGGEALTSLAVTKGASYGQFDAADVTWTSLDVSGGGQPSHAIMYDDSHAGDWLMAAWEVTTLTNGGNYTLQWNANGIILLV